MAASFLSAGALASQLAHASPNWPAFVIGGGFIFFLLLVSWQIFDVILEAVRMDELQKILDQQEAARRKARHDCN